ncbi:hypothetical protein V8E52_005911 [Russula decolorans]
MSRLGMAPTQKLVCHPVSPAYFAIAPPSISCHPGSLSPMDRSEGLLIEMDHARRQKQKIINKPRRGRVTVDILPEDVLLEIFDCHMAEANEAGENEEWEILVHCGHDNIIAALGHNDRVCEINLAIPGSLLESVFAAMQKTFVALNRLWLNATDDRAPVVSDSFLGGSAPHLRQLWLDRIPFPFPVLRKLPLSSPNLPSPHSSFRARSTSHWIPIPSIAPSPGKPTSSAHTLQIYPPCSH